MLKLTFVTGNPYKFEVGKTVLEKAGINLVQKKLETPEIQSADVSEIAKYSAKWSAEKLGEPIILTDAGYYIEALNGFPGPFIKYINKWLTSDDLLKLMLGKSNRKIAVKMCLAYCEPDKDPVIFTSQALGAIAEKAVKTDKQGSTPINEIFIPDGFNKVETEISREEMVQFWSKVETYWQELINYLTDQKL